MSSRLLFFDREPLPGMFGLSGHQRKTYLDPGAGDVVGLHAGYIELPAKVNSHVIGGCLRRTNCWFWVGFRWENM